MVKPLIDGDILRYEIGFACEYPKDEGIRNFDFCASLFDSRIEEICNSVGATEPPTIYLTGDTNFRDELATVKKYKGTRKSNKPFHFKNITLYIEANYEMNLSVGIEADDMMALHQMDALFLGEETIICSRDKDLKMVPGWHYSWECGRQPQLGPIWVDEIGWLKLEKKSGANHLTGVGKKFFYSQILTGDTVDNIPGLKGCGPVAAHKLLDPCETEQEMFDIVAAEYAANFPEDWEGRLLEQGRLLWMITDLDEEGQPVMWTFPKGHDDE